MPPALATFDFTLCRVADGGKLATKMIGLTPNRSRPYDLVAWWRFHPVAREFNGMVELLQRLMDHADIMLVRGAPVVAVQRDGWTAPSLRRWQNEPVTLRSVPRQWLALDLDDVPVRAPLGDGDRLQDAAEYVRAHRPPPEFAGARMVATATGSTGLKGLVTVRLRLFVLLDRVFDDGTLKRWARGVRAATDLPLDDSLFQAGQPHYTARPRFVERTGPAPRDRRVAVLDGTCARVSLAVERYEAAATEVDGRVRSALASTGMDWRTALDRTLGVDGFFFLPLSQCLGLAAAPARTTATCATLSQLCCVSAPTGASDAIRSDMGPSHAATLPCRRCPRTRHGRSRAAAVVHRRQIGLAKGSGRMTFDVPRLPRTQKLAHPPRAQRQLKPSSRSNGAAGDDTGFRLPDTTADAVLGPIKVRAPTPVVSDTTTVAVAGAVAGTADVDADAQWDAAAQAFKTNAAASVAGTGDNPYAGMSAAELLEAAGRAPGGNGSDEVAREHVRRIIHAAIGAGVDALDRDEIEKALVDATGFKKTVIQRQWTAASKRIERAVASGTTQSHHPTNRNRSGRCQTRRRPQRR